MLRYTYKAYLLHLKLLATAQQNRSPLNSKTVSLSVLEEKELLDSKPNLDINLTNKTGCCSCNDSSSQLHEQ